MPDFHYASPAGRQQDVAAAAAAAVAAAEPQQQGAAPPAFVLLVTQQYLRLYSPDGLRQGGERNVDPHITSGVGATQGLQMAKLPMPCSSVPTGA